MLDILELILLLIIISVFTSGLFVPILVGILIFIGIKGIFKAWKKTFG